MAKVRDPQNDAEWREAMAAAHACLALDAAREYGLVTGGPGINVRRCEEMIRRGEARGVRLTESDIDHAIDHLISELRGGLTCTVS
ncbi:MAG TPA: hypothetical protein VGR63_13110 [Casimicrobiaceae bacterium]|nr:hypothetical protein [Casimicrobiaceae bacterium]